MIDAYTMTGPEWLEEVRAKLNDECFRMMSAFKTVSLGKVETSYEIRFCVRVSPKVRRKSMIVAMRKRLAEDLKRLEELEAEDRADP